MRCYSVLSRNTILIRAPWRHCAQWSKPDIRGQIPYDSPSVKAKVARSCLALCNPMDYTVHGILQARILEWVAFPFPGDLPNPGIKPRSPALQVDSLPAEPPGKPRYTGVDSLSLFQWIFPTQVLNLGLLHCRQILYQLSYQGSPGVQHSDWRFPSRARQSVGCIPCAVQCALVAIRVYIVVCVS